jgi:hypothetical protein
VAVDRGRQVHACGSHLRPQLKWLMMNRVNCSAKLSHIGVSWTLGAHELIMTT